MISTSFVLLLSVALAQAASWNHDELGEDWASIGSCGDVGNQSPISVITSDAIPTQMKPLYLSEAFFGSGQGQWENTNHGVLFKFTDNGKRFITGGPLKSDIYELLQFHIHWGSSSTKGSEHLIDGVAAQAEIHFVHKKAGVSDFTNPGDLAVYGILINFSDDEDVFPISTWLDPLNSIRLHSNLTADGLMDFSPLLGAQGMNAANYVTYDGSLTTPGCSPVVTWMVNLTPVTLSSDLINALKKVKDSRGFKLNNNYRVPQPIGSREVQVPKDI